MSLWGDDHNQYVPKHQWILDIATWIISAIVFIVFAIVLSAICLALHPFMIGLYICFASGVCVIK
jgi:hypothetical protein